MKNILILLVFMCGLYATADAQKFKKFTRDTLTDAATNTYTWSTKAIYPRGIFEATVDLDSISGTPAGTINYQYSLDPAGGEWYTVSTDAMTDSATQSAQHKITDFAGYAVRVTIVHTGTQSVGSQVIMSYKKD